MKMHRSYLILLTLVLLQACGSSYGESEDYKPWQRQPGVAPVNNALYKTECGSCHFAYQPGLLPSQSWQKIMAGLSDHFGDNAELDANTRNAIENYLVANGAEKSSYRRSKKIMRSLRNKPAPLRITELSYIKHRHHEIPKRLIAGNEKVGHLSRCDACHQQVESGSFSERQIKIPGYGRWDD